MPKAKKATKKVAKKKDPKYKLTLNLNEEEHVFKGDSMEECFTQFEKPLFIKSMVYITAETKEGKTEMLYNGREAQRILANHGSVALLGSNLEKRLA